MTITPDEKPDTDLADKGGSPPDTATDKTDRAPPRTPDADQGAGGDPLTEGP